METAIRFSQNSLPTSPHQHFLKIDIVGRALQVYNVKDSRRSPLQYELVYASNKLPPFRAFDWHPTTAHLAAIGQTSGEANLVNLEDTQQSPVGFTVRTPRSCNAVGLNNQNWLAVGHDKVRSDACLNVWDINQRLSPSGSKTYGKGTNEPLHKLASVEPVNSLRFWHDHPELLAAAVKGQFIRLYDLREATTAPALQIATRCVNNIALDTQDENYFASCLPSGTPTVSIWDRRMTSRNDVAHVGFGSYISQSDQHPEVSVELPNVVEGESAQIRGLCFSKTRRGYLGVLSSTGQLRMLNFHIDPTSQTANHNEQSFSAGWKQQQPQSRYINDTLSFSPPWSRDSRDELLQRIVSFDFTTSQTKHGEPRVVTLTGHGLVELQTVKETSNPFTMSTATALYTASSLDSSTIHNDSVVEGTTDAASNQILSLISGVRFKGETETITKELADLAKCRWRAEAGYLLDASRNISLVTSTEDLKVFWSWLKHAQDVSADDAMKQNGIDLSFLGVFNLWMEEINVKSRKFSSTAGNPNISTVLRDLVRRLNLDRGKGVSTEYPHNRALCLRVIGVPWSHAQIEQECERLAAQADHTQAAAIALFAGEEKLAQKALRAQGSGHSHKMLAMAMIGARNRRWRARRGSHDPERFEDQDSESDDSQDEEWQSIILAVANDLPDCYAKSILAYVKTGKWEDAIKQPCLPLRYRVNIALRYFDDSRLTRFLSQIKYEITTSGDLEGIMLTGLGTTESVELFRSYVRRTNDIQTATLGLSYDAVSDRFLSPSSPCIRIVQCYREAYKALLMSWGLKFDKTRFDIAVARAVRECKAVTQPRKKEQIRLFCAHCNQSISHFGHEQQIAEQNGHMTDTPKHPLTLGKAAVAGTICPKCGRHLPRCGVCDLWLGVPDETYSKWYKRPPGTQRNSNNMDLSASMVGSTITAIGPSSGTPSVAVTGSGGSTDASTKRIVKPLSIADLAPEAIEVVDKEVTKQEREKRWIKAMHKFTVFCTRCSHGFHAEHAKLWFDGSDGNEGHRTCPVPLCDCLCNG